MNTYPVTIIDMTTAALVTYQGRNYMVLIERLDGEYVVNTRAFGPTFEGFRGYGATLNKAVTDLLFSIYYQIGLMAEAMAELRIQYIKDTKYSG